MPTRIRQLSYDSPGPNGESQITLTHGGSIPADTTIVLLVAFTCKPNLGGAEAGDSPAGSTAGLGWTNFGHVDDIGSLAGFPASTTLQVRLYIAYVPSFVAADTTVVGSEQGFVGPAMYSATYYAGNILAGEVTSARGNSNAPASPGFSIPAGYTKDGFLIAVFSGQPTAISGTPALASGASIANGTKTTLTNTGAAPNISVAYKIWEASAGPYSGAIASQIVGSASGQWIVRVIGLGGGSGGGSGGSGGGSGAGGGSGGVSATRAVGDVALVWASFAEGGEIDATIIDDDVGADQGLRTAVLLSLFTDRRAADDDVLPAADGDLRGWWGDEFAAVEGDLIGSRLWLLDRSARRADVAQRAEDYAKEALAWMLEDKVASSVQPTAEVDGEALYLTITLTRPTGDPVSFKFRHAWDVSPSGLPDVA